MPVPVVILNLETNEVTYSSAMGGPSLYASKSEIKPDGVDYSRVTYFNEQVNAPTQVTFSINGVMSTVNLVNDRASVDVVSQSTGDTIEVSTQGLTTSIEVL